MSHVSVKNLNEIADLIKAVAYNIELGNIEEVPQWLSAILAKYCNECVRWNREYAPENVKTWLKD